jgi:hypothetical protein
MSQLLSGLPWDEYIQGGYLGSSALDSWGKVGLEAWSAENLEASYDKGKASKYMAAGSALDALLTGDAAGKRIAVKPAAYTDDKGAMKPWNGNANACKAWVEENADAEIITSEQDAEIKASLPLAREALAVLKRVNGGEVLYQVTLRGELSGLKIQTRPDMMLGNSFPDLKYVNSKVFARFDHDFIDSRYFLQAGLAYGLGRDVLPGVEPSASFLLLESGTIHPRCRVVEIPRRVLQAGWDKACRIADEIAAVKASPLGFVDAVQFSDLDLPAWAEARL